MSNTFSFPYSAFHCTAIRYFLLHGRAVLFTVLVFKEGKFETVGFKVLGSGFEGEPPHTADAISALASLAGGSWNLRS
jgi:hypothetical protein